ncbi:MAG: aKG-HExxH-type peptide beta-hydroxylase [Nitrospiraceae bacterium]
MVAQTPWLKATYLATLVGELRTGMQRLLFGLCDDLDGPYGRMSRDLALPVDLFRIVGHKLPPRDFSNWKVVGWIEEINDLVYFLDVQRQLTRERHRADFAKSFLAACTEQFYEHSYLDDLFPNRKPEPAKLPVRLTALCTKLAKRITQQGLLMCQVATLAWLKGGRASTPPVARAYACRLDADVERAELPGLLHLEPAGCEVELPVSVMRQLARLNGKARLDVRPPHAYLCVGDQRLPLFETRPERHWKWEVLPPRFVIAPTKRWPSGLVLGPTLEYGRELMPKRVMPTPGKAAKRITQALAVIKAAWPEGYRLFRRLTERIVPLKATGVVSFSYRHRPGLSFINTFDRGQLDLIDDLIHENSHHHLNLLLRKFDMRRGDHHQEIFYSPWRRSLRPLHGILHATFTFTMGARLFERLSFWADGGLPAATLRTVGLTERDMLRARFRCLEEVESVRYSLHDLAWAADRMGWLSPSGVALVRALDAEIGKVARRIERHRATVMRSRYGALLRRHVRELEQARATYGRLRA